jgi:hypothetical protein
MYDVCDRARFDDGSETYFLFGICKVIGIGQEDSRLLSGYTAPTCELL